MKKIILLFLLCFVQICVYANELTLSDVQNSGCMRGTRARANEDEKSRTIILTKEGNILTVQLLGYEATCNIEDFIITPSVIDGSPCSVIIKVEYIDNDEDCICPYNISFTIHELESSSFRFSCWWYNGLVNLTEGEPLVLEDIKEDISIDGMIYTLDKVALTAKLIRKETGESEVDIPSELSYDGQKYTVTGIGSYVFHSNAALTSITIPGSITYIGEAAFYGCSNLKEVCCQADDAPGTGSWVFDNTPIASATLHVPAGSIEEYKTTSPWSNFGNIVGIPQEEYFPEGTKWTEIRLDTLKYDSWYSKVDGEWVPNFETIEYRVLGIYSNFSETFGDNSLKCVYTNCSEWTDSLSLLIVEGKINEYLNYGRRVMATVPIYFYTWDVPSPAMAYNFDWRVGMPISFIDILSTTYDHNSETAVFGIIEEINEGNFGGVRPLSYTDVNGVRFIQGIGVTTWNDGECIFGPVKPYEALSAYGAIEPEERHYRSMLVHFERDGEVLYNVWPEKGTEEEPVFLTKNTAWVDGFGYEQDGQYKTNDVKLFYYTTAGDTLINDKTYFRIQRSKVCKTYDESKIEVSDDTLRFFMREDETGDVWLYTEDKNVFYEISHNTLYEYLADGLVGRDLFLFNAKKKYAVGDALPLGMSVLEYPDGFQEGQNYWQIYDLDVENVSERNLLDGNTYSIYNNYFIESIGPLDGPLSGIGSPNTYNLDIKQLFAFYRDGQMIYKNKDYLAALEEYFPNILDIVTGASTIYVTFTQGRMATIILPTTPDASKGKYYRLDRYEDGQIIFEQELQPQAHIPYIIVPNEDFSINLRTLDLAGCYRDTVSVAGISFIGSYVSETFDYPDGFYIDFIDITPDCRFDESCVIGALRAYLLVRWDDPYNQGGTRVPPLNKRGIVLRDYETGISMPSVSNKKNTLFDLQGRELQGKPSRGIYIENGKKVLVK